MKFILIFSQGTNWKEGISLHNQPYIPEHAVYVQSNFEQGKVLMAGPFADQSGGAIILNVVSEEEAHQFANQDPAVIHHIFTYELKQWHTVANHYEGIDPGFNQVYLEKRHHIQRAMGIIE